MITQYATFAMAAILIVAVLLEMKTGRIPNWLTALPFVIFAGVLVMADDRTPLYWQMGLAGGVFVFGLIMFAIGGMGAGAVKLMSGTVLFIPQEDAFYTLIDYLVVLFVSTFVIVQILKMIGSETSSWNLMANAVIPLSF